MSDMSLPSWAYIYVFEVSRSPQELRNEISRVADQLGMQWSPSVENSVDATRRGPQVLSADPRVHVAAHLFLLANGVTLEPMEPGGRSASHLYFNDLRPRHVIIGVQHARLFFQAVWRLPLHLRVRVVRVGCFGIDVNALRIVYCTPDTVYI